MKACKQAKRKMDALALYPSEPVKFPRCRSTKENGMWVDNAYMSARRRMFSLPSSIMRVVV